MGLFKMVIRGTTRNDINVLCGSQYKQSLRALTVDDDGQPVAIVGVLHTDPLQCFSEMTPAVRKSPKTIVKTALLLRRILDSYSSTVYAIADVNENDAPRFLKMIGFEYECTNNQGEIYRWPQQSHT